MNLLNQFLILGVAIGTLASVVVLFVVFVAWIWSLKHDLHVHAPLLDGRGVNRSVPPILVRGFQRPGATTHAMGRQPTS
jgi:hypothetical protein